MAAQTRIQFRRGTASEWSGMNPILYAGEMGYETDTKKIKVGDGTTFWNSLSYATVKPEDLNELVDDRINDLLVAGSNIQKTYNDGSNTLTLAVTGVSLVGHSHTSSDITNFNSSVSGLLPVKSVIAGTNISVTPTGDAGFIVSTNGVDSNTVKDIVGASVSGVSGVVVSYNNTSKITTVGLSNPSITSSNITDFNSAVSGLINVKSLSQGTGIGITNNAGVHSISVTGIPSSLITDFSSSVGSVVSTEMVGGSGISLSYNTLTNNLTVSTSGVSFNGHSHVWSNITDASSKATLNELAYLSGVSPGSVSAINKKLSHGVPPSTITLYNIVGLLRLVPLILLSPFKTVDICPRFTVVDPKVNPLLANLVIAILALSLISPSTIVLFAIMELVTVPVSVV